jgi:hypothetical protein
VAKLYTVKALSGRYVDIMLYVLAFRNFIISRHLSDNFGSDSNRI